MFSTIRVFERELRCNLKGVSSLKRLMSSQTINVRNEDMTVGNAKADGSEEEPIWRNPEKHAIPQQSCTYSEFKEDNVDWKYVERLLPLKIIPEMTKNCGVLPSGWRPPQDPPPDLSYYIRRGANHLPELFLERRRDLLNPKTMDFEYVELVIVRNIYGDIFACERDLREFLEFQLQRPIGTHVDELKGLIRVKGADRTLLEKFVFEKGF